MKFEEFFMYEGKIIEADAIFELTESILSEKYAKSSAVDGVNVFFHLLNEFNYLLEKGYNEAAAYTSYLISYYVFHPLTPPHSESLALYYAKQAIKLSKKSCYREWMEEVLKGN